MADNTFNIDINVSDNGTAAAADKNIKPLNSTIKDLSINTAGARRELIVLAHELSTGNFTRFSQSLIVMAERMDVLSLIFSPVGIGIGVMAAAVGLLAVAAVKGAAEQNKFNAEIALTGNFAGTTSGNLREMSLAVGAATNNFSGAKDAINQLTISGRFTADQIKTIGTAAADMSRATGEAINKIIGDYIKLADSPTAAAAKLNKQYNFLTVAVYDQIAALEKEGKTTEATALAIDTLARHQDEATKQIKDNMGTLQRAAAASSEVFHHWWDEVLGIGRKADVNSAVEDLDKQISSARSQLAAAQHLGGTGQAEKIRLDALVDQRLEMARMRDAIDANAAAQGKLAQQQQKSVEGESYLNTHASEYTSKVAQRAAELQRLVQAAKDAGKSQADIDKIISGFNANNPKIKSLTNDPISTQIEQIRGNIDSERIALKSALDDLTAQYDKGGMSYDDYVKKKEALQTSELQNELTYTQQIETLAKKKIDVGGVEAQRYLNQEADINEKLKALHNSAEKELAEHNKRSKELTDATLRQADNFNRTNATSNSRQLGQFFMTDQEKKGADERNKITDEYTRLTEDLTAKLKDQGKTDTKIAEATDGLNNKRKVALANLDATILKEKQYQSDFASGWDLAFRQYVENSQNAAQQASEAFSSLSSNMEDALAKFVTTGKLSFGDFARSVIADLARIQAKAAVSGILKLVASAFSGYTAGGSAASNAPDDIDVGGGFNPGRAIGGPVNSGSTYLVGENGPELLRMGNQSGTVVPNSQLGGGGMTNNITINVQGGQTNDQTAAVVQKATLDAMQKIADGRIANARRPGGLLYAA